ncbi:hypothetical protein [Streptomyces capitiformicae]|uniref:Uncharacterized protein n=1 Tax=Streptomyces capitiformicae TaxID=2014920 RepID=A0A919DGN9_9ACTN|nr:hypothetical protein [Streptomyces capitiformicae]GHE46107.1 hypothetical protein GCM10017771_66810 [Streptomyces capitiformicae]
MRIRTWVAVGGAVSALLTVPVSATAAAAEAEVFTWSTPAGGLPPGSDRGTEQATSEQSVPLGYVYEAAWLSTPDAKAYCESQGMKGIAEGRWAAHICREEYRRLTDIPLRFHVLYVKK